MNTEALFLFIILLLGLVLCSFLGGNCNKEGFNLSLDKNSLSNMHNSSNNSIDNNYNKSTNSINSTLTNGFDNYNHYTGNSSLSQLKTGMIFIDSTGNTVTVGTTSDGKQNLELVLIEKNEHILLTSTPYNNSNIQPQPNTFYSPFGEITAIIFTDNNGQTAIQINIENNIIIFTQTGSNNITSTQYYGSTGYPIQQSSYSLSYEGPYGGNSSSVTGPYGNTAYYAEGPYGNAIAGASTNNQYYKNQYQGPYGGNASSVTGPYGNTAYYAEGPNGNAIAGTSTNNNNSNNTYYNSLPPGIPSNQILPGQEDLYILKSEIVPPVCPVCPTSSACPRQEKCPPCPACARCPEPSFECKKVPNYNAIDNQYLPAPVLNDFSSFGM